VFDGRAQSLLVGSYEDGAVQRVAMSRAKAQQKPAALRAVAPVEFVQTDRDRLIVSSHLSDHPEFNGAGRSAKNLTLVSLLAAPRALEPPATAARDRSSRPASG
jgi:hypothetical protein